MTPAQVVDETTVKVYDGDVYKQRIIDHLENYDLSPEHKQLVLDELDTIDFDDEYDVISRIRDFSVYLEDPEPYVSSYEYVKNKEYLKPRRKREAFSFQDVWEIDMKTYSFHYLWCCHAIVYAIQKYDEMKAKEAGNEAP